jgi:transcriptional regulator with XRE-family HTH domain
VHRISSYITKFFAIGVASGVAKRPKLDRHLGASSRGDSGLTHESGSDITNESAGDFSFEATYRRWCNMGSVPFGAALKARREELGLSPAHLTVKTGVTYEYLRAIEAGDLPPESIGKDRLRIIFGVMGPFPLDSKISSPYWRDLTLTPEGAIRFRRGDRVRPLQTPLSEPCSRCQKPIQFGEATCPHCGFRGD